MFKMLLCVGKNVVVVSILLLGRVTVALIDCAVGSPESMPVYSWNKCVCMVGGGRIKHERR